MGPRTYFKAGSTARVRQGRPLMLGRSEYGGRLYPRVSRQIEEQQDDQPELHWSAVYIAREHRAQDLELYGKWACCCRICLAVGKAEAAGGAE